MSSPQMNTRSQVGRSDYPTVDSISRHEFGVQKSQKQVLTGGGRTWSNDEKVYLLQSRLQKMPYKHIAIHLKKTELACRLHYHQLSNGSNRRKRTSSSPPVTGTASVGHSPIISYSTPSPIHDSPHTNLATLQYSYSSVSPEPNIKLPSASTLFPVPESSTALQSPHPITILPKPYTPRQTISDAITNNQPLRIDTEDVQLSPKNVGNVDKERLPRIYECHRSSFWHVISQEYGSGVSPLLLEEAWKHGFVHNAPPTPCVSPDSHAIRNGAYPPYKLPTPDNKTSATSISALLGIDASPRSPKERELIRRMEEKLDI